MARYVADPRRKSQDDVALIEGKATFDSVVIRFTRQIHYADQHIFQAEVRKAPVPLQGGAFRVDVAELIEGFRRIFAARVAVSQFFYHQPDRSAELAAGEGQEARDLARLGDDLYELLPESFREGFPRLIQYALEEGRGIRLIFEARAGDKADRLLNLPWEIFFFQETQAYLTRSPRVLIVRRLLDAVRRSAIHLDPPFNVLHVIAHSSTAPGRYQIDERLQQMEREVLPSAVMPGRYTLVQEPGAVERMQEALHEKPHHILHFLGHGEAGETEVGYVPRDYAKRGYLRFVSAEGAPQKVTGEHLQHLLGVTSAVQLVVLNACRGGSTAVGNVALELIHSGLPYVVAMQEAISQEAARYFIQAFYTELQTGRSIEYAVASGRSAIAANMPGTIDWCLPALYVNAGVPEQPAVLKMSDRILHWASQPGTLRQLNTATLVYGALHALVGLLLLLSGAAPPAPDTHLATWITGGLLTAPPILSVGGYLWGALEVPPDWSFSARAALVLRLLGAASLGLGLSTLYCVWFSVTLLAALGFWGVLSAEVQFGLLCLVSILSVALGFSQALGHMRTFISEAQIEQPGFQWGELAVVVAGYVLLLAPLATLRLFPEVIAPPWGNLVLGSMLLTVGYALPERVTASTSEAY